MSGGSGLEREHTAGEPPTLVDLLRQRAAERPAHLAYTFLCDGETHEATVTFSELDRQARAIAAALAAIEASGERVLLLYPPGLDYVAALFGCLYAAAVAVPVCPPDTALLTRTLPRVQAIVADAGASVVLTTTAIGRMADQVFVYAPELRRLHWIATDVLAPGAEALWRPPVVAGETLAVLQYTSGSTGTPKGVMLDHRNLMHNIAVMARAFEGGAEPLGSRVGVSWLPPYHDMGLIGGILMPLYIPQPPAPGAVLMSPVSFLERPVRWLRALSRYRAILSGAPNFAYELCVRRIPERQRSGLDLSRWKVACCGAEPVRYDTLVRFSEAFAPCGFRPTAFYPCYGLAESTLMVTGGEKASAPIVRRVARRELEQGRVVPADDESAETRTLVGCGAPRPSLRVLVVDPGSLTQCPPGHVGEIWAAGASVAQGYWNRPGESARVFRAHLADTGEGPFLRTGDLGFVDDGELFLTGRLKDMMVIRGGNHYPEDIEHTVLQSHPALRPYCGAAFAVERGSEERLVIVQEVGTRTDLEGIVRTIRRAVAIRHGVDVFAVVLVRPGTVPRTSSGKIQRWACRPLLPGDDGAATRSPTGGEAAPAALLLVDAPEPGAGMLAASGKARDAKAPPRVPPETPLEELVAGIWCEVLGVEVIGVNENFFDVGGNSMALTQVHGELRERFPEMPLTVLFEHPTIRSLARTLATPAQPPSARFDAVRARATRQREALRAMQRSAVR